MQLRTLTHTYKRLQTLRSHHISALPVAILIPHSACNCRCIMCDIWKDNKNLKQLTEADITDLLASLKKLGTQQVTMSGGEALLNNNFFKLCGILKKQHIKISLLTTGLSIKTNANEILDLVDDLVVSLDGDEPLHDAIRNIPNAFHKLQEGVAHIKYLNPSYRITARTVIHRLNFRNWPSIISAAKQMGIDQISFLPADISSHAFNRQTAWSEPKQHEILLPEQELPELYKIIQGITSAVTENAGRRFIAESASKLMDIYYYYAAFYGLNPYPFKKCNAPWVSAVVEADGNVLPCFFHNTVGNIHERSLYDILNSEKATLFRKTLDMSTNPTCVKCVCSLNLSPFANFE